MPVGLPLSGFRVEPVDAPQVTSQSLPAPSSTTPGSSYSRHSRATRKFTARLKPEPSGYLLKSLPPNELVEDNPASARRQEVDAAGFVAFSFQRWQLPPQAVIASTGWVAVASLNSPAGLFSMSKMGLDRRSRSSSSAGVIAWAGIFRKISTGSDRGVMESRGPASSGVVPAILADQPARGGASRLN